MQAIKCVANLSSLHTRPVETVCDVQNSRAAHNLHLLRSRATTLCERAGLSLEIIVVCSLCLFALHPVCAAMYSNFAQTFAAQRKTVRFSGYATSSLLNHKVSVSPMIKDEEYTSASSSQDVIAINWGDELSMTWQQFMRKYTIWFAAKVLGVPQLDGVEPFANATDKTPVDLEQLQTAINAINSIPDVDWFDNIYYDYIKREDVKDMGYYSRDNWPLPIAIQVRGDM